MQRTTLLALGTIAVLCSASPARAQDSTRAVVQQGARRSVVMMQPYTIEQIRARAVAQLDAAFLGGLAYAKSKGETVDQYAQFLAKTYAPGWGPPGSGRPVTFFRAMNFNWLIWPQSVVEQVVVTDTLFTIRVKPGYAATLGTRAATTLYGSSLEEYDRLFRTFTRLIVDHLGMRYTDRQEGEWLYQTVSGIGSAAAPGTFRMGTYTANIAQLPSRPDLTGTWELTFGPDGKFAARHDGKLKAEGQYSTSLDQLTFGADSGELACNAPGGTYRWIINPQGGVTFVRLAERCEGRRLVLSRLFTVK